MTANQPQPIVIPDGDIVAGSSIVIPLHIVPLVNKPEEQEGGYKIGIVASLTNPVDQAQTTGNVMFEFDTGGQGFWADPYGQLPAPTGNDTISITYDSGIEYIAVPTPLTVAFPEASATLGATVTVGLIKTIVNRQFPIFGKFYGDFGAALQGFRNDGTGDPVLLTVLAQLPAPYNSGFIVDLGTFPGTIPEAASPPRLIVGLTDALRGLFPNQIAMTPAQPYACDPAAAPIATYQEVLITADVTCGTKTGANDVGVVFDTGAPTTVLHPGTNLSADNQPETGEPFALMPTDDPSLAIISVTAGNVSGADLINCAQKPSPIDYPAGYVNTGLIPFFNYPIMFDLANGKIGFPQTTGEQK